MLPMEEISIKRKGTSTRYEIRREKNNTRSTSFWRQNSILYIQRKTPSDTGSSPPQITDNASSTNYITVTSLTAR
ncbi:hypothetical protein BVRB_8g202140 [Beta vulgaris subsp. vulgaris]|uniref:Uncharacterized protein n=1 Tax=Beta vulgaris subsp. vulgaris TaxID=3555 RepID=A0A0J8B6B7_BETVV|nr:hypothetical protein BVRB_8g202140 [Beta vulgaris subsp. vulgaris]